MTTNQRRLKMLTTVELSSKVRTQSESDCLLRH